ncbi:MAG: PEP-CTERM system histidine kinase PrsK [Gammaproteobacteria bacterium]|nr:PEP-CTERM system histidine kinase PrsK [Gammaproteobacteria bacterium]
MYKLIAQNQISTFSYSTAAVFFAMLGILLMTSWRGRLQGILLVVAVSVMVLWASVAAYLSASGSNPDLLQRLYYFLESVRYLVWYAFLLKLLHPLLSEHGEKNKTIRFFELAVYGLCIFSIVYPFVGNLIRSTDLRFEITMFGYVLMAITGLALIEQLFRNTKMDERWSIKFLCLGVGGIFAYDFFLYSNALLYKNINMELWSTRGAINALVVPLIAVTAARNPKWSLQVFVSRHIVFHTTALLGAGFYLLIMAAGGYYIRDYGGTWGGVAQITFMFGAMVVLFLLMFSGTVRAKIKVFLNKHFYNYKYDYRDEWTRFTKTLSMDRPDRRFRERAIEAVAEIVESPGGMLWLTRDNNSYQLVTHWNFPVSVREKVFNTESLIVFLEKTQWIIDLDEYYDEPEMYDELKLPPWLAELKSAWLIIPLMRMEKVMGFIVLTRPRSARTFNWEDSDLLKAASRQAASYLALLDASEALADARQFEAFNRLSAFVVHDIKNVVAQLSLVVKNAERHIENPEFMKDAVYTVQNAVNRMNKLLGQLKQDDSTKKDSAKSIDMVKLLSNISDLASVKTPAPEVEFARHGINVIADRERLASVLSHLLQNAQEATTSDGWVKIRLDVYGDNAIIDIEDNGCGMDEDFIKERLFKPFDTTKGNAGMGIGVYESREYISSLGGELDVSSVPGKGTLFQVRLPLHNVQ